MDKLSFIAFISGAFRGECPPPHIPIHAPQQIQQRHIYLLIFSSIKKNGKAFFCIFAWN